jgi:hypothetical protein
MPANYPYAGNGGLGGNQNGQRPNTPFFNGIVPRSWNAENDYQIDRERQRSTLYTGIENFVSQDLMVTESAGAIWDRSLEHLGTTDKSIITLRRILIDAAKNLAKGIEPPAVDPALPYDTIRSAEKVLAPNEDWRVLGTNDDPMVQQFEELESVNAST